MAKKQTIGHFNVGDIEYTEIGDDVFLILGRWGNHAMLVYNPKNKPSWSETVLVASEVIRGGNGYYFISLPSPKRRFLGINTKGSFFQYYHWLFDELKLEVPVEVLSSIAQAEQDALTGTIKPQAPLLSSICRYTWTLRYNGNASEPKDYYCGRNAYNLISPIGELGKKKHKEHLMIELAVPELPPAVLVENNVKTWINHLTKSKK